VVATAPRSRVQGSIAKKIRILLNTMQNISPDDSLLLPRNRQKTEMISLSYDVNDMGLVQSNICFISYSS